MRLAVIRNVGQWERAGASEGGGRGPRLTSLLCQASSSSVELSRLQSPEIASYCWLQMTFASIYLLHFDLPFNFRSIHSVCVTWGSEIEAAGGAVWTRLTAAAPEREEHLTEATVEGLGDLGVALHPPSTPPPPAGICPVGKLDSSTPPLSHTAMGTTPVPGPFRTAELWFSQRIWNPAGKVQGRVRGEARSDSRLEPSDLSAPACQ